MGIISGCRDLKVNLKAKMYICVTSTIQRCPNKIIKIFLIEDFFHLPLVSTTPVANLDPRISQRIFEKIRNGPNGILWGWGETDWWKKPEAKKSRDTVPLITFFSSEKRKLDVEYTWADDLWGSFDARTGQWNGVVRQVNLNPQIICHHLSSKISWHCPFNYILWQVGTKMTDLGVSFISYTAERYYNFSRPKVRLNTDHRQLCYWVIFPEWIWKWPLRKMSIR